ncbi:hypothetical protein K491DRAFT_698657 [Lophiostoma macrostomum CBS 122681]|uniref:Uncharacterized protein n=1 Tax=Lophiostoma macrostomum CBS 122681 TaxID=1314788 RepID=A0A6A6SP88_9PLEO|nr:hypothetical protein K491DRAFT_698657 [Lophiostoma macrostomum CBS 122681]
MSRRNGANRVKRKAAARQRARDEAISAGKSKISTRPNPVRVLKNKNRQERCNRRSLYHGIMDPYYGYKHRQYPEASLAGLPAELRQQILIEAIDEDLLVRRSLWKIKKWIGDLSSVSPLIRIDMAYVGRQWRKEAMRSAFPLVPDGPGVYRGRKKKIELQSRRPHRCWYCDERHYLEFPKCPTARNSPALWKRITKVKRTYGRKVMFSDGE